MRKDGSTSSKCCANSSAMICTTTIISPHQQLPHSQRDHLFCTGAAFGGPAEIAPVVYFFVAWATRSSAATPTCLGDEVARRGVSSVNNCSMCCLATHFNVRRTVQCSQWWIENDCGLDSLLTRRYKVRRALEKIANKTNKCVLYITLASKIRLFVVLYRNQHVGPRSSRGCR